MKKKLFFILAVLMVKVVQAQNIQIPDAGFKAYLVAHFDTNGDGEISIAEAAQVKVIEYTDKPLSSLQGIEYFTTLEELDCSYTNYFARGGLTSLDISKNTALLKLRCSNNQLDTIDLSRNKALKELHIRNNYLTSLNLDGLSALEEVLCDNNRLQKITFGSCYALIMLNVSMNQIESIDLTETTALRWINISENRLDSLNFA
jgi:hypothetical protein